MLWIEISSLILISVLRAYLFAIVTFNPRSIASVLPVVAPTMDTSSWVLINGQFMGFVNGNDLWGIVSCTDNISRTYSTWNHNSHESLRVLASPTPPRLFFILQLVYDQVDTRGKSSDVIIFA
jgi:hypothetical protein